MKDWMLQIKMLCKNCVLIPSVVLLDNGACWMTGGSMFSSTHGSTVGQVVRPSWKNNLSREYTTLQSGHDGRKYTGPGHPKQLNLACYRTRQDK